MKSQTEFYCPLYDSNITQYDCDEISAAAQIGRLFNDCLPSLISIYQITEKKEICLQCERNGK